MNTVAVLLYGVSLLESSQGDRKTMVSVETVYY
jgi:hypothetical protein